MTGIYAAALRVLIGLVALAKLSSGQLVDADCTTLLGGSAPAEFSPSGGAVTDARLVVRNCVSVSECATLPNRVAGSIATQYRVGNHYIINFESEDKIYDLFLLSDSSGAITRNTGYIGNDILSGTGGTCYTHTLTTDTIEGFPTARNFTDVIWNPVGTPNPTTVTFRALARISGSDIFVERSVSLEPTDCSGSDAGQNIAGCDALYNGESCFPTCEAGYDDNGGTVQCTGGAYVVSGSACVNRITNWCTETDLPGQDYTFTACTDKRVGASCTGYCNNPSFYTEGAAFTCGADRKWARPAIPCTYNGLCPLTQVDQPGVEDPSPTGILPCSNSITGDECIARCIPGYTPTDGIGLRCEAGGWNATPACTPIPNLCDPADITGERVNAGDCTLRDASNTATCTYDCDDDYLANLPVIRCNGATSIGWSRDDFFCESPLPTPAPVPTPQPTNFPLPTATVIPTGPTPPTTPTLNPFFLNQPSAPALSDEGIYIIIGAGGGAALLAAAACVGLSLRSTRKQYETIIDDKDAAANHYVDERFGQVNKLKYNAFDNW